jgi:thiol-disulfide isomerase/thioredoxin
MRKLVLFALSIGFMYACNKQAGPGETVIKISAEGSTQVVLERLSPKEVTAIDTLESTDGNFEYTIMVDTADFFLATIDGIRVPFFSQGNEEILIEVEALTTGVDRNYQIKGNSESRRIKEVNDLAFSGSMYIDSIGAIVAQYQDSANFAEVRTNMQQAFEAKLTESKEALLAMIDADPSNLANLFIWPQSLANQQLVTAEDNFEYYVLVDSAITAKFPNNPHAVNFSKQLTRISSQVDAANAMKERQSSLNAGNPAPEISLPNREGNVLNLSDLKGQVVLVDFWAAWCRPCRAANPTLVAIYNQYKDRGFTVMSVSFDGLPQQQSPQNDWLQAIEQDGLIWDYHVSDLRGWSSAAGQAYGIQSIPFTVLVDREGNIIDKNINLNTLPSQLETLL